MKLMHPLPFLVAQATQRELVQMVASSLQAHVRLVQLGKPDIAYPGPLARYGVAQTRTDRRVGGHLNIRDVMSPHCQRNKHLIVERLDKIDKFEDQWQEALVEDRRAGPFDIVRTKLDFAAWLRSLRRKPRQIARTLANGERTRDVARKFQPSAGRISQLRNELARSWHRFVGEEPALACA